MCPKRFATTAFGINRTGSGDSSLERSHILPFMQSILLIIATSGAWLITPPQKKKKVLSDASYSTFGRLRQLSLTLGEVSLPF